MKNKKSFFTVGISLFIFVIIVLAIISDVNVKIEGGLPAVDTAAPVQQTAAPVEQTAAPTTTQPPVTAAASDTTDTAAAPDTAETTAAPSASGEMTDTKEIIDKYTLLVNKFKKEKPAYKKKEFQALPEEFRNLGTAGNLVLDIASGYMTTEEDCEELVRSANSEDLLWDMPIHNSDVGCLLTDYDAVAWAKHEKQSDGSYKISFSLKQEVNAEPTPGDTLTPKSAHGTVMQPISREELTREIEGITSKIPGLGINDFSLTYNDCVFQCVYNPETDEVSSITHNIVIDIKADIHLFVTDIAGSARLLNDMLIYDITW